MKKKQRLIRTLARLLRARSPLIFPNKRHAMRMTGVSIYRDTDNFKNCHFCPCRYDRQIGNNKTKTNSKTQRKYERLVNEKRSDCSGCKGFSKD